MYQGIRKTIEEISVITPSQTAKDLMTLRGIALALTDNLEAKERELAAAVECINGIDEALKFQRYSAVQLRISEWRGALEGQK